jgi:predicted O-linked N-acetylglucosamine transferase (SPINDLY family)
MTPRQMLQEGLRLYLRLANDRAWRGQLEEELRRRKDVLYENVALAREFEQVLEAAVAAPAEARGASCS